MGTNIQAGCWFWSHKLIGILTLLAHIAEYDLNQDEVVAIKHGLTGTNDELDRWTDYRFEGRKAHIAFQFAYDDAEQEDMIHIRITTSAILEEQVEMVLSFQAFFKALDL